MSRGPGEPRGPGAADLAAAFRAPEPAAEARPPCPEPEALWDASRGELPADETREIVDHTATCAACAAAWRMAASLEVPAGEKGESPAAVHRLAARSGERKAWRSAWRPALAAAAVLALAAVGVTFREEILNPPPEYRAGGEERIESLTPEDRPLARDGLTLAWRLRDEADREGALFTLRVMTEELEPVVEVSGLETAEHTLAPEALAEILDDSRLLWQVEATLADGERVRSATWRLRLR